MAASVANGTGLLCYGLFIYNSLICGSVTTGEMNLPWGTAGTPRMYYGDSFHNSIVGKEVDVRYYATGLSESEFNSLFTERKLACSLHCQVCSDLVTCSQCKEGWYLDGSSNCIRCNTCCVRCTGPGNSACLSCAPSCMSTASNTCVSKN